MEKEQLIRIAQDAMHNAYAPYSNFHVGAAVLLKDGKVISGVNVENASYGLTVCAERNALFACYGAGYRKEDILAIAVISDFEGETSPCGACRQVMIELMPVQAPVYMVNKKLEVRTITVGELLPFAFTEDDLK